MYTTTNRRQNHDRRQKDIGPPKGWKDRRRTTERRIPAIEECQVSESEWLLYFGKGSAHSPVR
jgi:hypothetical protein